MQLYDDLLKLVIEKTIDGFFLDVNKNISSCFEISSLESSCKTISEESQHQYENIIKQQVNTYMRLLHNGCDE